ncbi:hypothetical protein [Cohnella algarum]|uniref:hypothetical protein n=1 Tax=Cohnella algarum TaxID=2044859 RepID=UPI00196851BA|nr:hypothetical protein [Cohnella algarum]MBN2981772.1 hypothetical protein [Cohnella algarum]
MYDWSATKPYYPSLPLYTTRQEMMPGDMSPQSEMMAMMRQHMMMTTEIKRVVDIINERCMRMEEMMKGMGQKMRT